MSNPQDSTTSAETQTGSDTTGATTGNETTAAAGNESGSGASADAGLASTTQNDSEVKKLDAEAEAALSDIRADIAELILKLQKNKAAHPILTDVGLGLANALLHLV